VGRCVTRNFLRQRNFCALRVSGVLGQR
jgi:hypothetical protein